MEKILHKELSYQIQGAAIEVRKDFGSGHKESVYQNAFAEELSSRGITFEKEKSITIRSPKTGNVVGYYRPDFVIGGKIVVEIKAVDKTPRLLIDQLYDYLKNTDYELGYFINFSSPKLVMKRVIYTNNRKSISRTKVLTATIAFFVVISSIFVVLSVPVSGASIHLYLSAPQEVVVGSGFSVKLLIDTDQPLNAYDMKLQFPGDALEVTGLNNGNSLITIWQNQPVVSSDASVRISGGSFEAFAGTGGEIITINFLAKSAGLFEISFKDAAAFLANGKGTKVSPLAEPVKILIKEAGEVPEDGLLAPLTPLDTMPPEIKILSFERDPLSDSRKLFGFAVSDRESGIMETSLRFRKFVFWSDWQRAQNPTAVMPGVWAVEFMVVDNAGNSAGKTIYDWGEIWRLAWITGAAIAVFVMVFYSLRGRPSF